ncbi:MAG TPA: nickel-dependent lactate racemase [Anaerolineae bacterium]
MKIKLAYGTSGLVIDLPDEWNVTVVEPHYIPALPDATEAIRAAIRAPIDSPALVDIIRNARVSETNGLRVGVIFSDMTRPTPNHLILPVVLNELALAGVKREQITLFNALGTHRANSDSELRTMLGDDNVNRYRIVQNNAFDPSTQISLGISSRGHELWLNRELMACDVKVVTGFIEPHFFAGYSGGGKGIMPGMAGLRTVLGNHDADMIGHPDSTWGITAGNPIWEESMECASRSGKVFLLNVALNKDKAITAVFAGDLKKAHARGCSFVRHTSMLPVAKPFDIVVTTNSGYPLDLNLYQSVKGMCAAAEIVRQGGAIIAAAECRDGLPEHGLYGKLLHEASGPSELLKNIKTPGFLEQDQWEAQKQAIVQLKADVYLRSDGLTDEQIIAAHLKPCHSVAATLAQLRANYGPDASICVLPEGPQTIAYVAPAS